MKPEHASAWRRARRILAVRLDNMGDVLMTTPAIRALKASAHGRHVTLLTSASGAAVAAHVPEIDAVITADVPWMPGQRAPQAALERLVARLASGALRHAGRGPLRAHQSATCTMAGAAPRSLSRRPVPLLLSQRVRARTQRLPAAGLAGARRRGRAVAVEHGRDRWTVATVSTGAPAVRVQ
jgi:hypothetical protein